MKPALFSYTADVTGYTDLEKAVNQPYSLRIGDDQQLQFFWERDNKFRNDHSDFVLFKQTYDSTYGVGAFAQLLTLVLEPANAFNVAFSIIAGLITRRKRPA